LIPISCGRILHGCEGCGCTITGGKAESMNEMLRALPDYGLFRSVAVFFAAVEAARMIGLVAGGSMVAGQTGLPKSP